ncbi:MAG: two-component system, OmpR family, sensor histidine kinase BaeS [Chloroflexota bacterium]|jgi:signal transduction histidine kinase|nr:two-component system, OmpR family, sensor histidine kinase BaeS [Chloroflexota bacterium]
MFRRFFAGCVVFFVLFNVVVTVIAVSLARIFGVTEVGPGAALSTTFIVFIVVVGSVVAMGAMYGRAARPLRAALTAVERVADGDYTARMEARGPRELRRLVTSFNSMVERLETAESRRRRLLADVTHELRTPLSVIQGRIEGVRDGVYPRDDATLDSILEDTRHMSRIIEDLRVLSLAESGALRLARGPVHVGEVVDDVIEAYRGAAESGGVALESAVPADLPPADADATRVREVIENLISNAVRSTPRGGRVTIAAGREGPDRVAVSVADTGRGVAPEDLPRLFERFHRSPDSPGTGLGLAIARDLVRAHGGEIAASSEGEGRGMTVRFTLPVAG